MQEIKKKIIALIFSIYITTVCILKAALPWHKARDQAMHPK